MVSQTSLHPHHWVHAAHGAVHLWIALVGGVFAFLLLVVMTASTFAQSRQNKDVIYQTPQEETELQVLKKRVELLEEYARNKK